MSRRRAKKKVLFITGTRADFGKLKPLMLEVERAPEFECHIFATGMHTLSRYGFTYDEIRKSGFKRIFLYMNQVPAGGAEMDLVLAHTIEGLGRYVREYRPRLLVVHGDRVEALAGAIVGSLNNILVAHVEGGEISGTVDELIRHAVSKLSHIHFVANQEARRRLIQLGERQENVFITGSPEIDVMLSDNLPTLEQAKRRYRIRFDDYALFIYHPVTTEYQSTLARARQVVEALKESGLNFVVIQPNNDLGGDMVRELVEKLRGHPRFRVFPSLRFEHFLTLVKNCRLVVGNSSVVVREAPVYGVPSINLGTRQMGRFHHRTIVTVPEEKPAILAALADPPPRGEPSLHFGKGDSARRFMQALRRPSLWQTPPQKQFRDLEPGPPPGGPDA